MYLQHLKDIAEGLTQPGVYDKIQNNKPGNGFAFPFVSPLPQKNLTKPTPQNQQQNNLKKLTKKTYIRRNCPHKT